MDETIAGVGECAVREERGCSSGLWVSRTVSVLVGLGIFLRWWRFQMNFPLWGDESLLAENFLRRDYPGLALPLANMQVAPIGFLWVERLAVSTFGFHEWSLRLQGLIFAVLAMALFARLAMRLPDGASAVCATGVFAVSYFAIRYAAETKPYSADLFFSVAFLFLACEWHATNQARWLWWLACLSPLGLLFSFPSVFVAGGISLAILPTILCRYRKKQGQALGQLSSYIAFNLSLVVSFGLLQRLVLGRQYQASSGGMIAYWKAGFPPGPAEPALLAKWCWETMTSAMFAVPLGGDNSGSILSSLCFYGAMVLLWRKGLRFLPMTACGIFALAIVAAALHRYPMGNHPRLVQYFAPIVALGVGVGIADLTTRLSVRYPAASTALLRKCGWILLAIFSVVMVGRDSLKPYQSKTDEEHRKFASRFWIDREGEETICLMNQLPTPIYNEPDASPYHCYRAIALSWQDRTRSYRDPNELPRKRLKCVIFHFEDRPMNREVYEDWMRRMELRYKFTGRNTLRVTLGASPDFRTGCYDVFEFEPREIQ